MINILDKRYSMPYRTYFSQVAISELHIKMQAEGHSGTENSSFSLLQLACGQAVQRSPISLTVPFINEEFDLNAHCLQTTYFPDDHTGQNNAAGLREDYSLQLSLVVNPCFAQAQPSSFFLQLMTDGTAAMKCWSAS